MISKQDRALYRVVKDPEQACEEVLRFYRVYHSSRYVGKQLLIRLEREVKDDELASLNDRFSDVLRSGAIVRTQPLPEDVGTDLHRPGRIELDFNRKDFGRLRQLIDAINDLEP